jgi:hypothetical protein
VVAAALLPFHHVVDRLLGFGGSQEQFAELALKGDLRRLQRVEAGAYDLRLSTVAAPARHLDIAASVLLEQAKPASRKLGRPRKR